MKLFISLLDRDDSERYAGEDCVSEPRKKVKKPVDEDLLYEMGQSIDNSVLGGMHSTAEILFVGDAIMFADAKIKPSLWEQSVFVVDFGSVEGGAVALYGHLDSKGVECEIAGNQVKFRAEGEEIENIRDLINVQKAIIRDQNGWGLNF
ncbi:MAG: hypothetical protein COV36_04240 [Alphaproteobacteria bacterium CG11_big_fil_rev_8_21_14_0_20_44_7]|nr:MAG: hypothetical protein COV36_04240 [Alphaproteobacteria bacterium CG11_big_fil_rev_8_21_14_0_20_44_7]